MATPGTEQEEDSPTRRSKWSAGLFFPGSEDGREAETTMTRQEFEAKAEQLIAGQPGAIMALLADDTIEIASGQRRGQASISIWRNADGPAMINDTARGRRQNLVPASMSDIRRVLDEEEEIGPVEYIDGKRDKSAR